MKGDFILSNSLVIASTDSVMVDMQAFLNESGIVDAKKILSLFFEEETVQ